MIKTNLRKGVLKEISKFINLNSVHLKRNYKQKLHNVVRDYVAENLNLIKEDLILLYKELRVNFGTIDIFAKDKYYFYIIEVKTGLLKYPRSDKERMEAQLFGQRRGVLQVLSLFTNKKPIIKLILIDYCRDVGLFTINSLENDGKIIELKKFYVGELNGLH